MATWLAHLPVINACFNALSACLLLAGFVAIRRGHVVVHRSAMLGALAASTLFLVGYLTRVALGGTHRFPDVAPWRTAYLALLTSHMILAVVLLPLVFAALYFALRQNFVAHKATVAFTWPIWMYVSTTGVMVYFMLYHLAPTLRA